MAKLKGKGTALQQMLGTVYTTVAQVISLDASGMESETYEADTLDNANAGIPYEATGRSEGGTISGELFYDPALAGHQALMTLITTPADESWKIVFSDTSEWTFTGASFGMGTSVVLNDGIKGSFTIKVDGLPTFPS